MDISSNKKRLKSKYDIHFANLCGKYFQNWPWTRSSSFHCVSEGIVLINIKEHVPTYFWFHSHG